MAAMYAVYHGPGGLAAIAAGVHRRAARLAATLRESGLDAPAGGFFDTIRVRLEGRAAAAVDRAREAGYSLLLADADTVGVACDETTTDADLLAVATLLAWAGPARAPRSRASSPGPGRCSRPAWPAAPGTSAIRSSTSTGARRPCSATCAGWPTSTSRWTVR